MLKCHFIDFVVEQFKQHGQFSLKFNNENFKNKTKINIKKHYHAKDNQESAFTITQFSVTI